MRTESESNSEPNLWKGLLAGAFGGLIASFAMSEFNSLVLGAESSSDPGKEDSTIKVASGISWIIFHHVLTPEQKTVAGPIVHYAFGMTIAAAYGVVVESWSAARRGWGLPFGMAVWLGAHVITVPALGLSQPITRNDPTSEAAEGAAHLIYGAVVEGLRRTFRNRVLR